MLNKQQVEEVINWMNEWEQLKGTAIPMRFAEDFNPKEPEAVHGNEAEKVVCEDFTHKESDIFSGMCASCGKVKFSK